MNATPLSQRFRDAWRQALNGDPPPRLDDFLGQAPEADRPTLHAELTRIDGEFRSRQAQLCSVAAARMLAADSVAPADPDATANVDPAALDGDATALVGDGTVNHDPADDPGATLDPVAAAAEAGNGVVRSGLKRTGRGPAGMPTVAGYELLGELGRGGMGVVYKARHLRLNRLVALKMVLAGAHAGDGELARFYSEAEAVAALLHPNIVQIYEIGEHDGLPFFSLEYVDGDSLNRKIGGRPRPPAEAAQMVETLALAMAYAHLHGIIHRDLKPANVLLTKDGLPKISDFGLAKKLEGDAGQTRSGTLMGTPNYMAPEQARGDTHEVGPRADVYALGVILYQMLTGRTPFVGTTILDTLQQVQTQEPVPPSRLQAKVPADLETVCLKCLQKEPAKRYESADALAADLHSFLAGEPIKARPVGSAERLWRWCKRNPRVAALTTAVLLLLVTVAVGSTVMAVRIGREHEAAVAARDLADQRADEATAARQQADQHAEEARQAQKQADANAKVASDQADLALRTLQVLIVQVQKQLEDAPRTQKLKKDLLDTAMGGLREVAKSAGRSGSTEVTAAAGHVRLGQMFRQLGDTEAAFREFQLAHDITKKRAAAQPRRDAAKKNLAISFTLLGDMSQELRRDMRAALGHYRTALALYQEMDRSPNGGEGKVEPEAVRQALAAAHTRVAVTVLRLGDPAGSRGDFEKSLAIRRGLADARPADAGVRQDLALSYNALGEVSFLANDLPAARAYYEKCLAEREALLTAKPDSPRFKRDLAAACGNFGDVDLRSGDLASARRQYERGLALTRELAEADPENADYRRDLGVAHYRAGVLERRGEGAAAAEAHFRACLQVREALTAKDPKNDRKQIELLQVLPRCGRHERAAEMAEGVRGRVAQDAEALVEVARCYAQCAAAVPDDPGLRGRYAAKAVDALREAVALGYKDAVSLALEPDLEPLRAEDGYKDILRTLQPGGSRAP